jgi:DNA-binding winged helix-turn-helix (wHTH) protein
VTRTRRSRRSRSAQAGAEPPGGPPAPPPPDSGRDEAHGSVVTFGPFTLDLAASRLVRDGVNLRLRRQAFHALRVLAQRPGQYLDYDELMAAAWSGVTVSRHTIDVTVAEVRRTLQEYGTWVRHRPKGGYSLDIPQSDELVRRGWHFWSQRTRTGFERGLECFQEAAAVSPHDHRAFEGQCSCYLLLASMGMRPGRQMYDGFLAAHRRAVALIGLTPPLRCDRGHGLHMYERRMDDAEAELQQAVRDSPSLAPAYVRLAMVNVSLGRLDTALDWVSRAYTADPLWPLVPMTEVTVRFWRREYDRAAALGARAVELHPYLLLARAFYAQALEFSGALDEALVQYRHIAVVSQGMPWVRGLEGVCLVKLGRRKEARAILAHLDTTRRSDYVAPYAVALLRHALGQVDEAFAELAVAIEDDTGCAYSLLVDPKADGFRRDPRFADILRRYYKGAVPTAPPVAALLVGIGVPAAIMCEALLACCAALF